jgi:hypothetical protein
LDKPGFALTNIDGVIFDMICHDLKTIPSTVIFSVKTSFSALSSNCSDLETFWRFPILNIQKNLETEIQHLKCYQTYKLAEHTSRDLVQTANQLIGYWMAKLDRKKSSQPGGQAKIKDMEDRIVSVKNLMLEKGEFTDKGFEISKSDYHAIIHKVFTYDYVSAPTKKKYIRAISEQLSEDSDKKIEIILT